MKRLILAGILTLISVNTLAQGRRTLQDKWIIERGQKHEDNKKQKKLEQLTWAGFYQDLLSKNNKLFNRLYRRFQANQIVGIEVLIASSSWSAIESGFGHTMLRFVDNTGTPDDDIVVSFIADVDSVSLDYIKGIFGGYSVFPIFKTLRSFMTDYVNVQKRDLDRYIILSTAEIRSNFINELKKNIDEINNFQKENLPNVLKVAMDELKVHADKKYGPNNYGYKLLRNDQGNLYGIASVSKEVANQDQKTTADDLIPLRYKTYENPNLGEYTFFSNNCAGALVELIQRVGFPYQKNITLSGIVPLAVPNYLKKSLINPYPKIKIKSLRPLKDKLVTLLDLGNISDLNQKLSLEQMNKVLNVLTDNELRKLGEVVRFETDAFRAYEEKLAGLELTEYSDLYGITALPDFMYSPCIESSCAVKTWNVLFAHFDEEQIIEAQDESLKTSQMHTQKRVRRKKNGSFRWVTKDKEIFEGLKISSDILIHNNIMGFLHENWEKQGVFK